MKMEIITLKTHPNNKNINTPVLFYPSYFIYQSPTKTDHLPHRSSNLFPNPAIQANEKQF
jgi:hypothetical protein